MTTTVSTKLGSLGNEVIAQTDPVTGGITLSGAGSSDILGDDGRFKQSSGYHFHGYSRFQANSDLKFLDLSGALNDGAFQANLSAATAWATANLLTQPNPTVASNQSLIALPPLSFDYLNGDNLLLFWRGMATPEATTQPLFGDTSGASSANGIRIVVTAAGKLQVNGYQFSGTLSRFGGTSSATVFEAATMHSFAVAIDGTNGKHCYWADGARDSAFASGFLAWGSGGKIDTLNATSFKVGGDGSTTASVQNGVACQHDALIILKGRRTAGIPAIADLDALVAQMHRSPGKLVTGSAW